jgi:hypothetical protein
MIGEYIDSLEKVEAYLRKHGEYELAAEVSLAKYAMWEQWQELIRLATTPDDSDE